jgi:large subunit ribosomal protein L25
MEKQTIKLEKRELTGKKAKRLLRDAVVPAVIYNAKGESTSVKGAYGELVKLLASSTKTTVIDVEIEGKTVKAIIKDVDTNPITDHIRHVSFFEVDEKTAMNFEIPFTLKGESPAVKNNLGVLIQISQTVKVKAMLKSLVPEISIDISELAAPGMTISVEDITLPDGITLVREEDAKLAIVTVTKIQKQLEVAEDEETEEEEEGAEGTEDAVSDEAEA